jgi:hypothetical protein
MMKMKIGENLGEKERLISMLTDELDKEKSRRKELDHVFKKTTKEYEKDLS